jgi:hypothetical protein
LCPAIDRIANNGAGWLQQGPGGAGRRLGARIYRGRVPETDRAAAARVAVTGDQAAFASVVMAGIAVA